MGRPHEVLSWLVELRAPVRAVYEAGPTGNGLARRGRAAGVDVQVCAPGTIARSATERVKTDKRDSIKLPRTRVLAELGAASHLEETAATQSVLHGLYWLVANLAERSPLLLAIDDVHWAPLARGGSEGCFVEGA